jgi:polar amino acid transport system substrate-binding protein
MQEQPAPRSGVTASAYKLPAHIAQSGILKVGLAPNSPPYFSNASGTITGLAKSIFDAVAHELGVTPEYTILNYSALVPALVAGKVDVAGVVFTDTLAREKQLDFIDYRISYRALLIQKGNPAHISGWNEICGHSVAVTAGAVSQTLSVKKSGECESNGKKPLKIIVLQDVPATQLAVANGRAEAYVTEAGLVPPLVKANPKLELGGEPFDPNYVGVGIKKGNTELSDVLMRAFTAYMRDGNYRQLMKEAGLESGIIDAPVFNAATTKPKK